jgi:hypothetical protein
LCGLPFTDPHDPPVADHVVPRSLGGTINITDGRLDEATIIARVITASGYPGLGRISEANPHG